MRCTSCGRCCAERLLFHGCSVRRKIFIRLKGVVAGWTPNGLLLHRKHGDAALVADGVANWRLWRCDQFDGRPIRQEACDCHFPNGSWFRISHHGSAWRGSLGGRMKITGRFPERLSLNLAACGVANSVAWRSIPDLGVYNFAGDLFMWPVQITGPPFL